MRPLLCAEVFEQAGEGGVEGVALLPARKIGDEEFAQLGGEILAAVGIESLPVAQRREVRQPPWRELALAVIPGGPLTAQAW